MSKSLIFVLAAGALIGAMLPTGRNTASAPATTASGAPVPVETRVQRQRDGHFYVDASVNGQLVRFMVDTGASMVALTEEDAAHAGIHVDPKDYEDVAHSASGIARGRRLMIDSVEIGGKRATYVRGAVIEGADQSLLGQSYLSQLRSVEISGDEMILR